MASPVVSKRPTLTLLRSEPELRDVGARSPRFRAMGYRDLRALPQLRRLGEERLRGMEAVAAVLPFRANRYVVDTLIDWDRVPDDPIFRLTFPQPEMLEPEDLSRMLARIEAGDPRATEAEARAIRARLNPHPGGQRERNIPFEGGRPIPGVQHKYPDTLLFFPAQGQSCHAYCGYCFRWAQFTGDRALRFASGDAEGLARYVRAHPQIRSVLFTGGDPLILRTALLARYVTPLLSIAHLESLRFGTKALSFWPSRFVDDEDAGELLRLFEQVRAAGKQPALMAHLTHPRELEPEVARRALARVRSAGVVVRGQAPIVRGINDSPAVLRALWSEEVRLGVVPYYLFVERDTGARRAFELPLSRILAVVEEARIGLDGLARTARAPVMSAEPGKVQILGVTELGGERCFALRMLRARAPEQEGRLFFARYDARATWLSELAPAGGEARFFFE